MRVPAVAPPPAGLSSLAKVALAFAVVAASALLFAAVRAFREPGTESALQALRLEISTAPTDDPSVALSPDGTQIAFVANQDRVPVLWVRQLDAVENRALSGTQDASFPFWSPDGRTIGFFAENKLKRIDVGSGAPLVVTDAANARGGAWNAEGVILFTPGVSSPVMRVAAGGGPAERVTDVSGGSGPDHRWPQFLPDGKRFLFSSTLGTPETNGVYIGSLDKTPPVRVMASDSIGRFAAPDRLLTMRQGALRAYNFDTKSGTVKGEPAVIAQGFAGGIGSMATSNTGMLAYRTGTAQRRQLVWVNRGGAVLSQVGDVDAADVGSPELSPDEQSVVVFRHPTGDNDVWLIELGRNLARRVTDGPPADAHPMWDPDGQHVVFSSSRLGPRGPVRQSLADGKAESLFPGGAPGLALAWTRDRKFVLLRRENQKTGSDLVAVNMNGEPHELVVAHSPADETEGQFSPDGRTVAFVSNGSGRSEVFVQSFPEGLARTQVSTGGGAQVRWSGDGKEIFYVAADGKMMAVSVTLGGRSPIVKLPAALFQTHLATGTNVLGNKPQYAVARDGRFLLNTAIESASSPIIVWMNWMKALSH